jgi:trimeric autotransporter adhesin
VSSEIKDHHFAIKTDKPNVKVSWQVTGRREDAYMQAHPFKPEQEKPENERGSYLYPAGFGQPASKAIGMAPETVANAVQKR